jgi:hypothetical protein
VLQGQGSTFSLSLTWAALRGRHFYFIQETSPSAHLLSLRRCRSQNELLTAGFLPPASAGVGGSQKGNLRPSVSVHDDLFKAPYKVADQHPSPAALRLVRHFPYQQSR